MTLYGTRHRDFGGDYQGLPGRVSAVDHEVGPGDERRVVGGEEQDGMRDLAGLGAALDQLGAGPLGMDVGGRAVEPHGSGLALDDLGPDDARADRVDPDVVGRQVHRHAPGHAEDGGLGRVVGDVVGLGDERGDRGRG